MNGKQHKVLAVASGGGHWVQLLRLRPAFADCSVEYLTTQAAYARDVDGKLHAVTDANVWEKLKLLKMFIQVAWVLAKVRPDVVITTGAAPGFAAIVCGKWLGAKTIWLDSMANSQTLSNSGARIKPWCDVWLTQWSHLAAVDGPHYHGAIL